MIPVLLLCNILVKCGFFHCEGALCTGLIHTIFARELCTPTAVQIFEKTQKGGRPKDPIWSQFDFVGKQANKAKCKKCDAMVSAKPQRLKRYTDHFIMEL